MGIHLDLGNDCVLTSIFSIISFLLSLCGNLKELISKSRNTPDSCFCSKQLLIYDTGGAAHWFKTVSSYVHDVDGIFLVYDVTWKLSLMDILYWANYVTENAGDVPRILIGERITMS